ALHRQPEAGGLGVKLKAEERRGALTVLLQLGRDALGHVRWIEVHLNPLQRARDRWRASGPRRERRYDSATEGGVRALGAAPGELRERHFVQHHRHAVA